MDKIGDQPMVVDTAERMAFAIWLGRALKSCHDDAVHEPIPAELLALLPPPQPHPRPKQN